MQNEYALVENLRNNLNYIREAANGAGNTKESTDLDHSNQTMNLINL